MTTLEAILLWGAILAYVLAFVALSASPFFKAPWLPRAGLMLTFAAVVAHGGAILTRWIGTGHAPVMGSYENSLTGAFFLPLIWGVMAWRYPITRRAAFLVIAATLLILGNGVMAPVSLAPLEPPYRSNWLVVHVVFAWFAFGSYLVASVLALRYLWVTRKNAPTPEPDRRPLLDELTFKLIAFGFISDSIMIASGAIWARGLWGRYWAWDPIETWSLVSWLIYGANLHFRFTLGWKGRRAAWLAAISVIAIIITFFGIGVISDVHTQLL
ncbi:MAG: cytochrome c biogenesis protein CcsA [Deltaproteobacteria bacterium]|nr:cytochrome c biogenesis protein CcsA [Deltaproteobacteria bacterium]